MENNLLEDVREEIADNSKIFFSTFILIIIGGSLFWFRSSILSSNNNVSDEKPKVEEVVQSDLEDDLYEKEEVVQLVINDDNIKDYANLNNALNLHSDESTTELYCSGQGIKGIYLPLKGRIKKLDCSKNELNKLDVSNSLKLVELIADRNYIEELFISTNNSLRIIKVDSNLLSSFPYSVLNPNTLVKLYLSHNEDLRGNIKIFKDLIMLEELRINNTQFYGSLEAFSNMKKLESLSIHNTDVDIDFQYLGDGVVVDYLTTPRSGDLQINDVYWTLDENGYIEDGKFAVKKWKVDFEIYNENNKC